MKSRLPLLKAERREPKSCSRRLEHANLITTQHRIATKPSKMLLQQAQEASVVNYVNVCAVTLLFYDTLINIEDEVNCIWRQKWSLTKYVYIASKYLAFVDSGLTLDILFRRGQSPEECFHKYTAITYVLIIGMVLAEIILLLRTWAIWALSRWILIYLVVIDSAFTIYGLSKLHHSLGGFQFARESPLPSLRPCFPEFLLHTNGIYIDYVCIMLAECNILALTLWRGIVQWRGCDNTLINIFYRDGIMYFVCLFVISGVNVLLYTTQNRTMDWMLLVEPQRIAHAILAARLVLNVR
ncbi:hypothetical protein SCHPADRAFT_634829 [Schizopora paradoxa]|uniref:DUF6533 domain-containing protein n=1 Tax=Schizopora paradoxa TaxID=27342 RepID=A0A0H2RSD4_9AGAM|nr:hypothetical protein SCHPADRAFT_634829 [Schizopora paradoxa]